MTLEEALADAEAELATTVADKVRLETKIADLRRQLGEDEEALFVVESAEDALDLYIGELHAQIGVLNAMEIPKTSGPFQIKKGDPVSLRTWALQRALNGAGYDLLEDGVFKEATFAAVSDWQETRLLLPDGVFGPASSAELAKQLDGRRDDLPTGLIRGFTEAEGGNWIAAVNWSVAGGVDCGYVQRRVYSADYGNQDVIRRAFDSSYQIGLLAAQLRERKDTYRQAPLGTTDEFAWRLACLHHNYPYAAATLSKVRIKDLSAYWTSSQDWVKAIGAHFPNGELVQTPIQWCKFYSLGAPDRQWPGSVTKYVSVWPD